MTPARLAELLRAAADRIEAGEGSPEVITRALAMLVQDDDASALDDAELTALEGLGAGLDDFYPPGRHVADSEPGP